MANYKNLETRLAAQKKVILALKNAHAADTALPPYTRTALDAVLNLLDMLSTIAKAEGINLFLHAGLILNLKSTLNSLENVDNNTYWSMTIDNDITYQLGVHYLEFLYYLKNSPDAEGVFSALPLEFKSNLFENVPQRLQAAIIKYFDEQSPQKQFSELFDYLPHELQERVKTKFLSNETVLQAHDQLIAFKQKFADLIPKPIIPDTPIHIDQPNTLTIAIPDATTPLMAKKEHYTHAVAALTIYQEQLIQRQRTLPQSKQTWMAENPIPVDVQAYSKPFQTVLDTTYHNVEMDHRSIAQQLTQIQTQLTSIQQTIQGLDAQLADLDPNSWAIKLDVAYAAITTLSTLDEQAITYTEPTQDDRVKRLERLANIEHEAVTRKLFLQAAIQTLTNLCDAIEKKDTKLINSAFLKHPPLGNYLGHDNTLVSNLHHVLHQIDEERTYYAPIARTYFNNLVSTLLTREELLEVLQSKLINYNNELRINVSAEVDLQSEPSPLDALHHAYQKEFLRPTHEREQVDYLDQLKTGLHTIELEQAHLNLAMIKQNQAIALFEDKKTVLNALFIHSDTLSPDDALQLLESNKDIQSMSELLQSANTLRVQIEPVLTRILPDQQANLMRIHNQITDEMPSQVSVQHEALREKKQALEDKYTAFQSQQASATTQLRKNQRLLAEISITLEEKKLTKLALACLFCITEHSLPASESGSKFARLQRVQATLAIIDNPHGSFQTNYITQSLTINKISDYRVQLTQIKAELEQSINDDKHQAQTAYEKSRADLTHEFFISTTDSTGDKFSKYLAKRNSDYAVYDWLEFIVLGCTSFFWHKTEYTKRNDYISELKTATIAYQNSGNAEDLTRLIEQEGVNKPGIFTAKFFAPRVAKGNPGYDDTLQYVLEEFKARLNEVELLNPEKTPQAEPAYAI